MTLAKRYAVTSKEMAPTPLAIGVIDNSLWLMKPSKEEGAMDGIVMTRSRTVAAIIQVRTRIFDGVSLCSLEAWSVLCTI